MSPDDKITQAFWIGLGVLFLGVCVFIYWRDYREITALSDHGAKTIGTLDEKYTVGGRPTSYTVTYQFTVNGKAYTGTSSLKARPTAREVTIVYDPENPETNHVEGSKDFYDYMQILFAALMIALIIGGIRWLVNR
jgi:hypothetical protein